MHVESKSTKETHVVVIWLSGIFFKRETVDCTVRVRGSGKTASLHPIGTSLRRAANTVKFVNL